LATVTDPAGQEVAYGYDNAGLLTGITDENGNRFATWAYDSQNRAILSEHAGGERTYTLACQPAQPIVTAMPSLSVTTRPAFRFRASKRLEQTPNAP
jgi:YD repeat-containing protein